MNIERFDSNQSFWTAVLGIEANKVFADFKDKDKSEGKKTSSNLMWAMAFCLHPKSPIFSSAKKWDDVKHTILKSPTFDWEAKKNKDLVDEFTEVVLTVEEKSYLFWCKHMKKREDYADSIDYKTADIKEIELVEDIRSKTPKAFQELAIIKENLNNMEGKKASKKPKSATDQGLL